MKFDVPFFDALIEPRQTTWYVLVTKSPGSDAYDTVTLSPDKDYSHAFVTVKKGEWSPKFFPVIEMADGKQYATFTRVKPFILSEDADEFCLVVGPSPLHRRPSPRWRTADGAPCTVAAASTCI